MEGLNSHFLTRFHCLFAQHHVVQSFNASHQQKVLQQILLAAQQAEDNLVLVKCVAHEVVGLSQAFVSGGSSVALGVYLSQAKKTLARYSYQGSGCTSTDGSRVSDGGSKSSKGGP